MVACGQWRWLWVVGGNEGGWGFGFAYCSSESSDTLVCNHRSI